MREEEKSPRFQAKDPSGPELGHWSVYPVLPYIVVKGVSVTTYPLARGSPQHVWDSFSLPAALAVGAPPYFSQCLVASCTREGKN